MTVLIGIKPPASAERLIWLDVEKILVRLTVGLPTAGGISLDWPILK